MSSIPSWLENSIQQRLQELQVSLKDSMKLAEAVKRMSDFYIENPNQSTPWDQTWTQIAQWSYFLPLNYLRNANIVEEASRQNFFDGLDHAIDFGSGLGAGFLSLPDHFHRFQLIEHSKKALQLSKALNSSLPEKNIQYFERPQDLQNLSKTLCLFSYSLTELEQIPDWALSAEALMILEPSTQQDGRRLQQWRNDLIQKGFHIWAPCTHHHDCPLLKHSKKDWCHHRIHWQSPAWMKDIEKNLPWRNQTMTVSYLLARKKSPHRTTNANSQQARVVGDSLEEKGKTRQLICFNDQRFFLSFLHKEGPAPKLQRGDLFQINLNRAIIKSNEIRLMDPVNNS